MQFLVTMTTQVPDGVTDAEVDEVRGREAAHSRKLAAAGQLLRLWRPPLQPGEWRTFGLFEAQDAEQLEQVLASMPLRIWRHDDVMLLEPHPNDPASPTPLGAGATEYFTIFSLTIPEGTAPQFVDEKVAGEATSTRRLAAEGKLIRLWKRADGRALGLWQADSPEEMATILKSLPLADWLETDTIPLTAHPSDPARTAA
ncbi:muconolactone delta-isomerase [Kribbella rubisoli]|uniref:Muconolactone delta-isomerase n=1 Tax=Kribbella rubisoli TaxID=3075929 RepID=A0A4Q7XFU3_9ACTN|nr:muconolactone Delta-isomerase family protein [Kribbella rubisoli]RZU22184.1 muconolactone delta-isomerase [Kribbella rubisoli]